LIYRYFGGLDGLADTLGEALAGWLEDRLDTHERSPTYAALIERLAIGYLEALRADPLIQRIVAWEMSDASPHVFRLSEARSRALQAWVRAARGDLRPPDGIDAPALNALIIAAVQQLVLAGSGPGQFAGLPLRGDADWERVRQAIRTLVRAAYGTGNPQD
jgi:AcrR family transcriptional regulator